MPLGDFLTSSRLISRQLRGTMVTSSCGYDALEELKESREGLEGVGRSLGVGA